jgi:hypothetical protein
MPTIHLLPVGTSLLDNATRGPDHIHDKTVRNAVTHAASTHTATLGEALRRATYPDGVLDVSTLITPGHLNRLRQLDAACCAERSSVAAVADTTVHGSPDDAFVLIASDSDDGLRAALLLAASWPVPEGDAVPRYVDDPAATGLGPLRPADVLLCRIPDLTMDHPDRLIRSWAALGRLGRAIQRAAWSGESGPWDVLLHLSGGYKAVIPHLLVLAEGIETVFRHHEPADGQRRPSARAVMLHEDNRREPVWIPVRWMAGQLLTQARELRDAVLADRVVPGERVPPLVAEDLDGQLIAVAGRHRRLNPYGQIMVNAL